MTSSPQTRLSALAALTLAVSLLAVPAAAQEVGARVGVSTSPDQVYFGVDRETPPLVDRLHFRPNLEVGIGDGVTLVGVNFEFVYRFTGDYPWKLYVGAGPALNIIDTARDTNAEGGFNILVGTAHPSGLFVEVKVGALDSPNFKFGVGYVFR